MPRLTKEQALQLHVFQVEQRRLAAMEAELDPVIRAKLGLNEYAGDKLRSQPLGRLRVTDEEHEAQLVKSVAKRAERPVAAPAHLFPPPRAPRAPRAPSALRPVAPPPPLPSRALRPVAPPRAPSRASTFPADAVEGWGGQDLSIGHTSMPLTIGEARALARYEAELSKAEHDAKVLRGDIQHARKGGIVRGKKGAPIPIVAHGGELVVPTDTVKSVLKSSAWLKHVREVQAAHGGTLKDAMKMAKGTYKK